VCLARALTSWAQYNAHGWPVRNRCYSATPATSVTMSARLTGPPAEKVDVFVSLYFDWVIERLSEAIHSQGGGGETIERPVYEKSRGPGSTDEISFWTMRDVREAKKSHVAFVVADTQKWEQQAVYYLDTDKRVEAFVKNAGMGFAIPYFHNGQPHEYVPDFIVRLVGQPPVHLVLETKGYDPLADVKIQAAKRWGDAVNADGRHGTWHYEMVRDVADIPKVLG
jgi:type III restriction enzyme